MKRSFSIMLATILPLAFWGCSGDSSSESTAEVVDVSDIEEPGVDSGEDAGEGSGQESSGGNESGKDSGPSQDKNASYAGFAEAGPFLAGGTVSMVAVDASTLDSAGASIKTTIASNRGDFAFSQTV